MEKNNLSQNEFSVLMSLVDYLPIIIFLVGGIIAFTKINNYIFLVGVILSTIGGLSKATWKLIMALKNHNHKIMTKIFHIFLPSGFLIMLVSVFFSLTKIGELFKKLVTLPSLVFLILGCVGILLMIIFAIKLDGKKAKSNWIEQCTNILAQLFIVIALIIC